MVENLQSALSSDGFAAALRVVQTLRANDYAAYLVGGCVRDLLLGHAPKDYDVATDAHPEKVQQLFTKTHAVGAHFGVVIVCDETTDAQTEVATFRNDMGYEDGRRPTAVSYADTPEDDVARRDFTINGMMLDPVGLTAQNIDAKVLDFVNGREDLRDGIVRAIGDPAVRFEEDKLRMLRAVRFAARFGFALEEDTYSAIHDNAAKIIQVSRERVRDELTRMLIEGHARKAFEMLDATGLLKEVLPEVAKMKGVEQPPQFHPEGDVWVHTLLVLEKLPAGCSMELGWAALLHDVGKPPTFRAPDPAQPGDRIRFNGHAEVGTTMTRAICNRLRMSNEETEQIALLVANHMRFGDVMEMKPATLKRFFRLPKFDEHLQLHWMDASSAHGDLRLYDYAKDKYENAPAEEIKPALFVSGRDLIDAGLKPGPRFKELLHTIEDAQLEGRITSKEEGLALLRQLTASDTA
ncbi:MAG: CCA tRNA nucleotidyltransferase [Acidobacteria bacterium]|nr:CCA tRNA nucleotidyltransferase [Acidobacteriota bacterium]